MPAADGRLFYSETKRKDFTMPSVYVRAWTLPNPHKTTIYEDNRGNIVVRKGGDAGWRNNNAGNMKNGSASFRNGAIGSGPRLPDTTRLAIFPSKEAGDRARADLLQSNRYKINPKNGERLTLAQAIGIYAPNNENNTKHYLAIISQKTGIEPSTKMESLSKQQIMRIVAAIPGNEGGKAGTETFYPAGAAENLKWRKTRTIDPDWAQAQTPQNLTEDDIRALMRTKEYKTSGHAQMIVANWYHDHYGPHRPLLDAAGRAIMPPKIAPAPGRKPPAPGTTAPLPGRKPIGIGGLVHVGAYSRSDPRVHGAIDVDAYDRRPPSGN